MAIPPRMKSEIEKDHLEHIEHRVKKALRTYRCQYTRYADDSGYQLVDAVTPPGAADITDGKRELELLAEHIIMTIVDDVWAGEDDNND